ncbi:hypothetical protein ACFRMQ_01205 [Kitasatospora sp. NPDC056783]|uniref:hypothetical protein n=1 Tax=Kitasatospora sp. NPDC056783 TaxID=3345943 RepID=UPI003686A131
MTTPDVEHRMRLFDHRIPSLYAGRHTISVDQTLDATGATLPSHQQRFDVRQLRFTIAPTDVQACYPLPGASGSYSQILPHITLDTPALPWLRRLRGQDKSVPWAALLVFRENELPDDPRAVGAVDVLTVRQLLGREKPGRPPAIADEYVFDDEWDTVCSTVLVPGPQFTALAPTPAEMAMLAHVREGGPPDATHTRAAGEPEPEPDVEDLNAVVVANRFPAVDGGMHVVHLVSLDGFEDYLDGTTQPPEFLRMVSLWSWSFESVYDTGVGFGDLAHNLADGPDARPDLLLRRRAQRPAQPTSAQREALDRLASGAAALPQRLDSGERTLAYYRGPLTAAPAQRLPAPGEGRERLESAGEALIYVEQHGVFDTGYAAAFSLGRQLSLGDAEFHTALMEFRKAARSAARRLFTRSGPAGRTATAEALTGHPAREAFDRLLTETGGARLSHALTTAGARIAAGHRRAAAPRAAGTGPLAAETLRATVARTETHGLLRAALAHELDPVAAWLARLPLLEMIPFEHLVPDPAMLPPESLRFAYTDPGWVRAAVDGALSVGVGHALDADLNQLAAEVAAPPPCAVLLRSDLVPNWPKIIMAASRGAESVEPVRRAVYGEDVLLILYPEVIDTFTLAEPPQGLHFGFSDIGTIELRRITGASIGAPMGEFPADPADDRFARFLRPGGRDVLNVAGRGDALLPALGAAHDGARLSSAQFALQMIKAPQLQEFVRP